MKELAIPHDLSKLEEEAAKNLSPEALAYILAGAGDTDTTRANAEVSSEVEGQPGRGPPAG